MIKAGNSIRDIKQMRLSDIELLVKALQVDDQKEDDVIEGTIDQAFPFLFG